MRAVQLVVILVLLAVVLVMVLRPRGAGARRSLREPDELVKDPVCQTYIVRSRAVSRAGVDGAVYFCSAECANRYARQHRG